ncbi:MAG: acyl carrier protein [Acidobacteriota bacterium]
MIADEVLAIVETTLGRRGVRLEDRLIQDLAAESMDIVAVAAALEDRFGVRLAEEDLPTLERVADLVARVESRG